MTPDALQRNISFFRAQLESWPLPDLVPRLARLLAGGEPVTMQQVATAGGWTQEQVQAALARHPRVDFDKRGRIAGFGLTLHPTPHSFTVAFPTLETGQTAPPASLEKSIMTTHPPGSAVVSTHR